MKIIIFLALRNFIRQRRRNIMLGGAIAFGIMVLTVAMAFTNGLTDTILNRIVIYMCGHVQINMVEQGRFMTPIIRDKDRFEKLVKNNIEGIDKIEESMGTLCRAVGNGQGDYVYMVGSDVDQKFTESFMLDQGRFIDYQKPGNYLPVLMSTQKAKALKVRVNDSINIRFTNVSGQANTATLKVVGIMKSQNVWMDWAIFVPQNSFKTIMGYRLYETGALRVRLHDPRTSAMQADRLWKKLTPPLAIISGHSGGHPLSVVAFKIDSDADKVRNGLGITDQNWSPESKGAVIDQRLAQQLGLKVGDGLKIIYQPKFETGAATIDGKVAALAIFPTDLSISTVLMNNDEFFRAHNFCLPKDSAVLSTVPPNWQQWLAPEWTLLKRSTDTRGYEKK